MLSVLIIDDQQEVLDVIRPFLERFGDMTVHSLKSAKEAFSALNNHSFDAIIVDYDMPEIDGIQFLKIIRSMGDSTPVIIFTGVGREYAAIEALNNGANFFLKKGEDILPQLRDMVHMIRQAVDGKIMGRSPGTARKILSCAVNFFSDPAFVIDREGKVVAWNAGMAELSGCNAEDMIGRNDHEYSVPFFKAKVPMLVDLIFDDDQELARHNFHLISRDAGTLVAWTRVTGGDHDDRVLWMKAAPVYDGRGSFIGVIGAVKDITGSPVT